MEDDYSRIEYHKNQTTGESFWRTFATNNTVSEYGSLPEARVADPDDAARIFSWQIVSITDPKGNKVQFRYQRENDLETGILNRGAFTRNYIDRIFYGNYYNTSKEEKFAFEVIFDYGSHELDNLTTTAADPMLRYIRGHAGRIRFLRLEVASNCVLIAGAKIYCCFIILKTKTTEILFW